MLYKVKTAGGVGIQYEQHALTYEHAIEPLIDKLDSHRGALFASSFEYPGRYTCWDIGFYNPPLVITCREKSIDIEALNQRGVSILAIISPLLSDSEAITITSLSDASCTLTIMPSQQVFSEEQRSRQPSVFSLLRELLAFFKLDNEPYLGLYGEIAPSEQAPQRTSRR